MKMVHLWDVAKNAQAEWKGKLQPQKVHKGGNGRGNPTIVVCFLWL